MINIAGSQQQQSQSGSGSGSNSNSGGNSGSSSSNSNQQSASKKEIATNRYSKFYHTEFYSSLCNKKKITKILAALVTMSPTNMAIKAAAVAAHIMVKIKVAHMSNKVCLFVRTIANNSG